MNYEIDKLQALLGYDLHITDDITIYQPTIGEIIEYGEKNYFSMIYTLTAIPSAMKYTLFKSNIDYTEITDFELFCLISRQYSSSETSIIFGNLNLADYKLAQLNTGEKILYDEKHKSIISESIYTVLVDYLRTLHGIVPKVEKAANKATKRALIEEDKENLERASIKEYKSILEPLVLSMLCTEEFKYDSTTIKNIKIYEFLRSVEQISNKKKSIALIQGSYSGMIDTKKIPKKEFNWMAV